MKSSNKRWTFGIISTDVDINNLYTSKLGPVIKSIENLKINSIDYEIIIVGANKKCEDERIRNISFINFDENIKPKWITKKKNIIIENAVYENIIIVHDYVVFDKDWYIGFQKFETEWDVCMCKVFNKDGIRWRDWILWWCGVAPYRIEYKGEMLPPNRLLYDDYSFVNTEMYINGTVIIGKKEYLNKNKLDENLTWGQGEDCEWSVRCRSNWKYKMNVFSKLKLLKQHDNT